jgi:hypothetical protein
MSGLTLGARRIRLQWMRTRTPTFRARPFTSVLSLLLALLFAYANFLCAAGGEDDKECERETTHSHMAASNHHSPSEAEASHQQQDPKHPHDCSRDSCFCATMNTVVTQQTVTKPRPVVSSPLPVSVPNVPGVTPFFRVVACEHGPPAIAPPAYLIAKIISPRAPPRVA